MSMFGSHLRTIQKDTDKSDMETLNVLWRSVDFFVVKNWFLSTDAIIGDTSVVLAPCWIP